MYEPADPRAALRCSHADRDAVAERLREAAGDGRIELEELEERLERAFAARTYGDLDALLRDLPVATASMHPVHAGAGEVLRISAPVSDRTHGDGRWVVPQRIVAEAGLGTVKIDFTEAVCRDRFVHVEAKAWAGSVVLLVPKGWSARTDEVTTGLGSVKNKIATTPAETGPVLRVTGHAAMGDVVVRHPRRSRFLPR